MHMPSMPGAQKTVDTPSQEDPAVAQQMQDSEETRKRQIMNMQGRSSTIGTSSVGDTAKPAGYTVSLLGGR